MSFNLDGDRPFAIVTVGKGSHCHAETVQGEGSGF